MGTTTGSRTVRLAAIVLAAAVASSGCSFIIVRRPPEEKDPLRWPRCTEHHLYPLVDTAYAVLAGAMTYTMATSHSDYRSLGLLVSLPMLAGLGTSSVYGWVYTTRCGTVREAYEKAAEEGR